MSIRLRFTFLYNAILAITLAIFGFSLYSIQASSTMEGIKKEIIRSSETLGESVLRTIAKENLEPQNFDNKNPSLDSNIPENPNNPFTTPDSNKANLSAPLLDANIPKPPLNYPPPKPFTSFTSDQAFEYLQEREIVRVLDSSGNLIASPYGRKEDALPVNLPAIAALSSGNGYWEEGSAHDQVMLIYYRPIIKNGEMQYILQVARPLSERINALQVLANTLIAASLSTLIIAFGIGWLFSGAILQPIHRITKSTQTIGEELDFSKRVEYLGPQDEVGQLATTINSMLTRLQDAYQQVARSLSQQRDFLADVSHELRTPLTTLRGNLGLMVHTPAIPLDEQKDIINDMVLESDRMIRLVNDLLQLARADTGRSYAKERFFIAPVVDDCCRQIQTMDEERKITWQCPATTEIIGDMDVLKQVMLIILDNSIKHSTGDVDVFVQQNNNQIQISISNTGEGIPPEKMPFVFDRFYRGDDESTSKGFGLGLPIAKSLVENQGGTIRIENEPGKGCKVIIEIPT